MSDAKIVFDHIHIVSDDPETSANWYRDVLGGEITHSAELRGAQQFRISFDGIHVLVRGQRPGEAPVDNPGSRKFADGYLHAPVKGADHFGFNLDGDLNEYCDSLRAKGATFSVGPHEFVPGVHIAYVEAPDDVQIEFVQVKR